MQLDGSWLCNYVGYVLPLPLNILSPDRLLTLFTKVSGTKRRLIRLCFKTC